MSTISFDPSETISSDLGIFGLPLTEEDAAIVLTPAPWEVTTSYGRGAANGPRIIRQASEQIDLFDLETKNAFEAGYFMREIPQSILEKNRIMKSKAQEIIRLRTHGDRNSQEQTNLLAEVNQASREMTDWVYQQTKSVLAKHKIPGLVGGDHSTPWGAIQAVSEKYSGQMGVLHIDAHADLRNSYQGFHQSHASIMYNVMMGNQAPHKLVQVGIRDFCEEEYLFIQKNSDRIKTFFDLDLKQRIFRGEKWADLCREIVSELPQRVYVSFDIDGLDPALCPMTGTPVPGGLSLDQIFFLLSEIHRQSKTIVGFDLNEVSTGDQEESEWDGNVGARVLFKLCGWAVQTNKLLKK